VPSYEAGQRNSGVDMFDHVMGLRPEDAARWTALVEKCRPVVAAEGMEAVQALLTEHGMSAIQTIAVTRALLGWDETPLSARVRRKGGTHCRRRPTRHRSKSRKSWP
jgi:hypothetical protein